MEHISPEVIDNLRHGRATRERKIAVCSSGAHLPLADRVEILAVMSHDPDEEIADRAGSALLAIPIEGFVEALEREIALPALFQYAAKSLPEKPAIVAAMVKNLNCPGDALVPLVPFMSIIQVQTLMDELDRVSASSALAAALENTNNITVEQKSMLQELRSTAIDEGRLAEAVLEAEPDPIKRQTLLQQIGRMSVSQRVQFAMKGSSEARRTLIRDNNKVVQRAVLQSPRLTDQEVEGFATMSSLTDEILRQIANNRNFRKNYTVVRNLMNNPKTPLDVSMHMLPIMNAVDLKKLTTNKNVPETLRTTAIKLQRTRNELKK